jgi:hypothetical protein
MTGLAAQEEQSQAPSWRIDSIPQPSLPATPRSWSARRANPGNCRTRGSRGHFPTEQAALKRLYLAIMSLDPTGRGRKRWTNRWKAALNAFDITFDGRLSAGRK